MESISLLRQMMAEQRFFEVQRAIELQLSLQTDHRLELLLLYAETMQAQQKQVPPDRILELAELELQQKNHEHVFGLLNRLTPIDRERYYLQIKKMKVIALEDKGQISEIHQHLSELLLFLFEKHNPSLPMWTTALIKKYFAHDFYLKLKDLALGLLANNTDHSIIITRELILSCTEKASPKGTKAKYGLIAEVLKTETATGPLEIYRNFCRISADGVSDKTDFKRLVEMVIYFDDFVFQVLILNLLMELELKKEAIEYAAVVRTNPQYNFVYFDKYFPHLKTLFVASAPAAPSAKEVSVIKTEPRYTSSLPEIMAPPIEVTQVEGLHHFIQLLKYHDYSTTQLCELATSFLQSEMPEVALKASQLILERASDDETFFKGSYLKLSSLLQLKDYRAALDTCLEALNRATTQNDILSFMYGQAEALIRLKDLKEAKRVLSRIVAIDSHYRLAQERLDKL